MGKSKITSRSARRPTNYGPATDWKIDQIARAATAAELYFPPVEHEEEGKRNETEKVEYTDDGFSDANNPTIQGIEDIRQRWGEHSVGTVVSVGTARHDATVQSQRWSFLGRVKKWADRMTGTQPIHLRVESESEKYGFPYFRFNARGHLTLPISLDEWKPRRRSRIQRSKLSGYKTREKMDRKFNDWLAIDRSVDDQLNECAKELVEARRNRMTREAKWERFALCARYRCREIGCNNSSFLDREEFSQHLADHYHLQHTQQADADKNNNLSNMTDDDNKIHKTLKKARGVEVQGKAGVIFGSILKTVKR